MGSVGAVVEISSDDEEIPGAAKSPDDALEWASHILAEDPDCKGIGEGLDDSVAIQELLASLIDQKESGCDAGGGDDDDDCIVLDGDPEKAVIVAKEKGPGKDGSGEELQIVSEKGELACRDFPHPRHLCASLPFSTSSHANHCSMCHCFVCDSIAPCAYWGKGSSLNDHCHATDKVAKWKKLRQSFKRKSLPASNPGNIRNFLLSTVPSSQQDTAHHVSVPQPFPPPRPNVIHPSPAGRVPVPSSICQNQQMHPSIRVAQNVGQPVYLPKASSPMPRPMISCKRLKRVGTAPTVCADSNAHQFRSAVPNNVPLQPAFSHVSQTIQVAPRSNIVAGTLQGYPPQRSLSAPVVSQGCQVQSASYFQVPPDRVVRNGLQISRCTSLTTQETQCIQDPLTDINSKSWQEVLASVASDLGVSDYNINIPLGQQSASTTSQPLHADQLLAQGKASQRVELDGSYGGVTSQTRPSNGHHLSNPSSRNSVLAYDSMQTTQPLPTEF